MTDVVHTDRPLLSPGAARVAAGAFAALAVVHLAAQLLDAAAVANSTQWLVMPALAVVLWCTTAAPRPRLVRLVLVALGFSWVGDTLPDLFTGDAAFLAMVGGFLVAQVAYAVAFWPYRRESVLHRRRGVLLAYVALAVVLVALCLPGAPGVLAAAVVVYAVCLAAMAVLATGVHRLAWLGGALFLVSDAMIALGAFADVVPPQSGFWIMLTYLAGQALLVAGVVARQAMSARAA
ncbi:lysoplasmalogenase family protein [Isoptericola haloaureus]|uniref:Lysoplasmalogenase family protein n=1 Tax=Isoptericola haloaureus TaxID=1542902 RepID=A0ABU7Z737_9MICO